MKAKKFRDARIEWWWVARPQFMKVLDEPETDEGVKLGVMGVVQRVDKILPPFIEERAMAAAVASLGAAR